MDAGSKRFGEEGHGNLKVERNGAKIRKGDPRNTVPITSLGMKTQALKKVTSEKAKKRSGSSKRESWSESM